MAVDDNQDLDTDKDFQIEWQDEVMVKAPAAASALNETYELSNLDQMYDTVEEDYSAVLLFYEGGKASDIGGAVDVEDSDLQNFSSDHSVMKNDPASVVKNGLEKMLQLYPWMAGRLQRNGDTGRREVLCCNEGASFVAGFASWELAQLGDVSQPNPWFDAALFPTSRLQKCDTLPPLIYMKVVTFLCGGFTISLKTHHCLLDGCGGALFLKNLCSLGRRSRLVTPLDNLRRREIFPPSNPLPSNLKLPPFLTTISNYTEINSTSIARTPNKYTFWNQNLEHIRKQAKMSISLECSRYQALVALLWKARAHVLHYCRGIPSHQLICLRTPMNIRQRVVPSIPYWYLGNAISLHSSKATIGELVENPISFALQRIIDCMSSINSKDVQDHIDVVEVLGAKNTRMHYNDHTIPSLVGLDFYKSDCGWGYPFYMCRPYARQRDTCINVLEGIKYKDPSWDIFVVFLSQSERLLFESIIKPYMNL